MRPSSSSQPSDSLTYILASLLKPPLKLIWRWRRAGIKQRWSMLRFETRFLSDESWTTCRSLMDLLPVPRWPPQCLGVATEIRLLMISDPERCSPHDSIQSSAEHVFHVFVNSYLYHNLYIHLKLFKDGLFHISFTAGVTIYNIR